MMQAIFPVQGHGYRHNAAFIKEHRLGQTAGAHRNARIRPALGHDHIIGGIDHFLRNFFPIQVFLMVKEFVELRKRYATNADRTPCGESRIAVFT